MHAYLHTYMHSNLVREGRGVDNQLGLWTGAKNEGRGDPFADDTLDQSEPTLRQVAYDNYVIKEIMSHGAARVLSQLRTVHKDRHCV